MPTMLIVGATSGIARATARLFADSGWRLQLAGRNRERLQGVADELGVEADLFPFDALDSDSRSSLWARLPVCPDAVLCAVGLLGDQAGAQRDPAAALRVMESNFTGLVPLLTQAAAAFEARGSGLIIGIGSVAGDRSRASNYVYGAAKAGFAAYLSGLRARLHGSGVRVLTVKPGYVATEMLSGRRVPALLVAPPARVARDIRRAVLRGLDVLYTPFWWRPLLAAYRALPESLAKRLAV